MKTKILLIISAVGLALAAAGQEPPLAIDIHEEEIMGSVRIGYDGLPGRRYTLKKLVDGGRSQEVVAEKLGTPNGLPHVGSFSVQAGELAELFVLEESLITPATVDIDFVPSPWCPEIEGRNEIDSTQGDASVPQVEARLAGGDLFTPQLDWDDPDPATVATLPAPIMFRVQLYSAAEIDLTAGDFLDKVVARRPLVDAQTFESTYAIMDVSLAGGELYLWRVRLEAGEGKVGEWSNFCRYLAPEVTVGIPELVGPCSSVGGDGVYSLQSIDVSKGVMLRWAPVEHAKWYRVEGFSSVVGHGTLTAGALDGDLNDTVRGPEVIVPEKEPCFSMTVVGSTEFAWPTSCLLENGAHYFWHVRGENDTQVGSWSLSCEFVAEKTTVAPKLGVPDGLSPALEEMVDPYPTFSWNPVAGASEYDIQIARNTRNERSVVRSFSGPAKGNLYVFEESIGLCPTKKYSWRVRARNSASTGPWARWTDITVSNVPVTLISPKDSAQITDSSVRLKWRRFEGISEYDFEVFLGDGVDGPIVAGYGSTYFGAPFLGNVANVNLRRDRSYTWRARARIFNQGNLWSTPGAFAVGDSANFGIVDIWNTGGGNVGVRWLAAADATGYHILRATNTVDFADVSGMLAASEYQWGDRTAETNVAYWYKVVADRSGATIESPVAGPFTLKAPAAPSARSLDMTGNGGIRVEWADHSGNETDFLVRRSVNDGAWELLPSFGKENPDDKARIVDSNVIHGYKYCYEVAAARGRLQSDWVAMGCKLAVIAPGTPVVSELWNTGGGNLGVRWQSAANATGYRILRTTNTVDFTDVSGMLAANEYQWGDTTAETNVAYWFKVIADRDGATSESLVAGPFTLTAPAAPSARSLDMTGNGGIRVEWADNSGNETDFQVRRSVDGGAWESLPSFGKENPDDKARIVDSNVIHGHKYCYEVMAVRGRLQSGWAAMGCKVAVIAPGTPAVSELWNTGGGNLGVRWQPAANASGYRILRATNAVDFTDVSGMLAASEYQWGDATAEKDVAYWYKVIADRDGATSESLVAGPFTLKAPAAPSARSLDMTGNGGIRVEWADHSENETDFLARRSVDGGDWESLPSFGKENPDDKARIVDSNVIHGHKYCYEVAAVRGRLQSDWAAMGCKAAVIPPGVPVIADLWNTSTGNLGVKWQTAANATGYRVLRSANGTDFADVSGMLAAREYQWGDTTAAKDVAYWYKVIADRDGSTSESPVAGPFTLRAPAVPGPLSLSMTGAGGVRVEWADNSGNETDFLVQRSTTGALGPWTWSVWFGRENLASAARVVDGSARSKVTYWYQVIAVRGRLWSAPSSASSIRVP
ncbi:MAG: hypothetical protein IT581_02100 [Verrucomicrobiales bacterium]|nr:hypothetical protein [Verrucomicrobiales bacterium]